MSTEKLSISDSRLAPLLGKLSEKRMLFEFCIYKGKDQKELQELRMKAGSVRVSNDENEALFGEYCCDLDLSIDGKECEPRVISAISEFHCLNSVLSHCRGWVRGLSEGDIQEKLYIDVLGELRELPLDLIFSTNDCITQEMEDKLEFADANGYTAGWQYESREVIEPGVAQKQKIELVSDFGLIQIFDDLFENDEIPSWDERAHREFASWVKGAVSLRVMENDDHEVSFVLCGSEPVENLEGFLHVVDVPFSTTGLFEVAEQPIKVKSGKYTLRWYVKQSQNGGWEYELRMWPGKLRKVSVVKQFPDG